ncbi:MAG: nucleotidyltransferase domain-containing protein [Brevinematales bacterium]|nr:nucleotidyltransferase domain-containing protein [Brevinematales bacterium]
MYKHHEDSLNNFIKKYSENKEVLAILLCGSLAHGYGREDSDIDLILIVTDDEYEKRKKENKLTFVEFDICTYKGGYIDCKVVNLDFLSLVAEKGSDPARYAFKDVKIIFSKIMGLEEIISEICKFQIDKKEERRLRFVSQLFAWKWFYWEAETKDNTYLKYLALQKVILFSTRIILNENNILFPFHKRMFDELKKAENKPINIEQQIESLLKLHDTEKVNYFCKTITDFFNINESNINWAFQFMIDNELNWLNHEAPIDDL